MTCRRDKCTDSSSKHSRPGLSNPSVVPVVLHNGWESLLRAMLPEALCPVRSQAVPLIIIFSILLGSENLRVIVWCYARARSHRCSQRRPRYRWFDTAGT